MNVSFPKNAKATIVAKPATAAEMAFGVDPRRRERYSLRQSRYYRLADVIEQRAITAAKQGRRLSLLDIGVGTGVLQRYVLPRPNAEAIDFHGADKFSRPRNEVFGDWRLIYEGDFAGGYPEIDDGSFDIVVCEQVLEHLTALSTPMRTIDRLLKPGGIAIVGVPIFPPGVRFLRGPAIHIADAIKRRIKKRGARSGILAAKLSAAF